MSVRTAVPSADFTRNIGFWQTEALKHPISITHHGRERLVLAAPDQFSAQEAGAATAEAELARERAAQAALLEHLDEAFLEFGRDLRAVRANAVAEALLGKSREQIQGRNARELFADPLAAVLGDRLQRVARSRRADAFEADAASGAHLMVRVFPLLDQIGVLLYDATDLRALQREREDSDALAVALAGHTDVALIKLDLRGRIVSVSEAFCRRPGFGAAEIAGYRFMDLVAAPRRRDLGAALERVMADKAAEQTALTIVCRTGAEIGGPIALSPVMAGVAARGVVGVWAVMPGEDAR